MKKLKLLTFAVLFAFVAHAFATAQTPDIIMVDGVRYALIVNPMEPFFREHPERRPPWISSGLWRGYIATFEIIQNELWVVHITERGRWKEGGENAIGEYLDGRDKVKVEWFTGVLVLPHGEMLRYVHMGYASVYEYYKLIEVENGNVINVFDVTHEHFEQFEEYRRRGNR